MENDPRNESRTSNNHGDAAAGSDGKFAFDNPKYECWYADTEKYEAAEAKYWFRQNVIGGIGIVVSAVTLIAAIIAAVIAYKAYVASTHAVIEAKRQADEAKREADAADSQIAVAKNTAEHQLRAYVYVIAKDDWMKASPAGDHAFEARLFLHNSGQTPAYKVQFWKATFLTEFPLKSPLPTGINIEKGNSILEPGAENMIRHYLPRPLTDQEKKDLIENRKAIWMYGEIAYDDIYGIVRCSKYMLLGIGQDGAAGRFYWYKDGNDADYCKKRPF